MTGDPAREGGHAPGAEGRAPPLATGARFGPYRLIRPLGKGGFAEVWEAESERNGRRVALKVLTELHADSDRALERFRQEGRLAAALANPHCVYVFDAGAHAGLPYIAMELVTGGTLADRLRRGPLPARAAVDLVLDVLDGLEAAQQTGILHRDVKPSNVFLDADGRAKIGDFGISKSLEADSHLTQTGTFLGTPYYTSPEQISGEPVDLRSDLYSVGAMLYELVTGKLPYAATSASAVLAQVLTREPVPFAQHGVAVPRALQRVILRLLAKPREKRFQSYEQLRAALLPLSSHGLAPGALARRFGAIAVDVLLFLPLSMAVGTVAISRTRGAWTLVALVPLAQLVYFALTERFWGGSVGKRLFRLRVTGVDGAAPSLSRVAWRAAVFLALYAGPNLLVQALAAGGLNLVARPALRYLPALLQLVGIGTLVSTMRRRNGYAGAHELASGTRVMAGLARARAAPVPRAVLSVEPLPAGAGYGPYRATGTLWRHPGGVVLLARDEDLHRDVWVHQVEAAAAPQVERLRARREGSLPWLQRGARDGAVWDAYGAPQGTALAAWAAERQGLRWREMRDVFLALARELESRFARDGTAGPLSPRHVWVEPSGRALLLDFPVGSPLPAEADAAGEVTPVTWRDFLRRVTAVGFQGDAGPLPEYARGIVASLADGGEEGAPRPVADFRAALEGVAVRPADVGRLRRAGPFAVLAAVPVLLVLLRLAIPLVTENLPTWYRDVGLHGDAYLAALRGADSAGVAADSTARQTAAAVRLVFAAAALEVRRAQQGGAQLANAIPMEWRGVLDSAAQQYPAPDSQQVAAARAWLEAHVPVPRLRGGLSGASKGVLQSFTVLGYIGAAGVILALLLRGGVLLGAFGIGVARTNGAPAGRLRCGARALVAWSPLLLLLLLDVLPGNVRFGVRPGAQVSVAAAEAPPPAEVARTTAPWLGWALGAVAVAGAAFAVSRPTRGLAERACGVVLVPK